MPRPGLNLNKVGAMSSAGNELRVETASKRFAARYPIAICSGQAGKSAAGVSHSVSRRLVNQSNSSALASRAEAALRIGKNMKETKPRINERHSKPFQVRLPGFVSDKEVGLGDVIKRATYAVGIKPCGGCERRAAALNRWMVFSGRR